MANWAESSSAVVDSVRFDGVVVGRVEVGWSGDDQPGAALRYIQGWSGPGVTRLSTQTLRDERNLGDVLVDEVSGEVLARSVHADLPKSEMRHILRSARESEPRTDDAALEIDGTNTAGVVLTLFAPPVGVIWGAAVRSGADTIVVIHDGDPNGAISLRTAVAIDNDS